MERTSILITAVLSVGITGVLGFWMIPWLKRLKYGQTINEIGPNWHKAKQGTPTMGGLMFIIGILAALLVGYITLILEAPQFLSAQYVTENIRLFAGLGAALCFGAIGFLDDYMKVVHKRNLGLTAKQKILLQMVVCAVYLYIMNGFGACDTLVYLPFIGTYDFGVWYYILSFILIVGMVNAVNLTDGIDGLASTVTFVVCLGFIIIATLLGYVGTSLLATAVAGGCIGFLLWNFYPAKVFMGDTGSLFLGGAVIAMAYGVSLPALLIPIGIVYLCEAGSVMMQVTYFKLTHGKRIFKMTPIHHHFEMSGWSEIKIVTVFGLVTLIGCGIAVWSVLVK
ncbi:MAG: phospho-N-acetylmuramoyl-pentapeptide-transferase [Oscillospiraceae bacterium]|nr:phospho-N-acetylmuramoyl-pentapeptide-transferase [Oscillospiraceae bacterium]